MALFTLKPAIVTKQIAAMFTIDYEELALFSDVPAGYYKNTSNWKEVFIRMKHNGSNQKSTIHFKRPGANADMLLTDAARAGTWSIDSVVIKDYDKGEVVLFAVQVPDVANYDILVQSNAVNGDLYIGAGQTVVLAAGAKRQYGDFVIETGGTLEIADGSGITEIEINESCIINGLIKANSGKHLSGTWSSTSVLGEALSYSIVQKAGGVGGDGQADIAANPGGLGGLAADGNGGGGGRSATFGALVGGNASTAVAGLGAGQDDAAANSYGVAGAPSVSASEAGSGGFRGAHGQGIYIKARKIQGTGTINAGGQKGGDGGNGGQYDSSGIFYGNGAGGGSAGGSGAKIWLRYKIGTPALVLNIAGGDKGNRGTRPNTNVVEAGHGEAGDAGSTSLATW